MESRITISLPFSFRGEIFRPSCTIDLDEQMQLGELPCLYTHLANENGIDVYSHEYDVMMMGELEFDHAEGLAAEYIRDGYFDSEGFVKRWHEQQLHDRLQVIASRHLAVEKLDEAPDLKAALIAAWELGRDKS